MASNALTLSWSASATGTAPVLYTPQYRLTGGTTFTPFGSPNSALTAVITGLQASTSYDFEIIASNSTGTGTSAVVASATSSGNAFPAAGSVAGGQNTGSAKPVITGPQNGADNVSVSLTVTGVTIADATATTGTLVTRCTSGKLGMTLSGAAVSGSGTSTITLTDTFAHCQSAVGTLIYTAPASPTTDTISIKFTDQSALTNTLLIQILVTAAPVGVAPNAATSLIATAPTTTSMQLNWAASTAGTAPVQYQPFFKLHTGSTFAAFGSPISALTAVVTGLSAGISYDFEIISSNSIGSATSAVTTASTASASVAPSAPTNLQVTATTATTMTFTWSPPSVGSATITYQPQFRKTGGGSGTRLWYNQPGTNANVWNTPLGDGATWGNAVDAQGVPTDADTRDARQGGFINSDGNFGSVFWVSKSTADPIATFDGTGFDGVFRTATAHIVVGSHSAGPIPGDAQYCFCDINTYPGIYWQFSPSSITSFKAGDGPFHNNEGGAEDALSDTCGEDWETGHNGGVQAIGIIRGYDLDPNQNLARTPGLTNVTAIQHVLRYALGVTHVKGNANPSNSDYPNGQLLPTSWPQKFQDYQGTGITYSGNLVYGTLLGIPKDVVMPGTITTNAGKQLWWTLQHYGAITRDTQFGSGGILLCADQDVSANTTWMNDAITDLPKVVQFLCPLRNQHLGGGNLATNPKNGPGNRVDVGPPLLTSQAAPNLFVNFGSPIPSTSVTITGLTANTSYDLDVIAINSFGQATSAAVTSSSGISGIPSDATGTQARPAQDMLNRFGINTHFGSGLYAGITPAQGIAAIQTIGATLVRDSDNG